MKSNLVRRCVIADSTCPHWSNQHEDALHALWSCLILTQASDGEPQWNFREQTSFESFPHLLSHVFESGCNAELFAMVAWTIWFRHNKVHSTSPGFPVDQMQQRVIDSLLEFWTA